MKITIKSVANYTRIYLTSAILCSFYGYASAAIPIQKWTLPNGATVFFVESPTIAMLDVQIDFDAGSRRDPLEKAGLASVTAGQAGKGSTLAVE